MLYTYIYCENLTGSPVCGEKVTNMSNTYRNCANLTGSPVCGNNVTNMSYTYYGCANLTGSPVCGEKVTKMISTYQGCKNLTGNAYFYSPNVSAATNCFGDKNRSSILNIFIINGSTTHTTMLCTNNTDSIVGQHITWTNAGAYSYNTSYNIYIYPVDEDMEHFRLSNEYNEEAAPIAELNTHIDIADDIAFVDTEYIYASTEAALDTGYAFAMSIDTEQLANITIEQVEVK
jgi:YHS domain-containing protein